MSSPRAMVLQTREKENKILLEERFKRKDLEKTSKGRTGGSRVEILREKGKRKE